MTPRPSIEHSHTYMYTYTLGNTKKIKNLYTEDGLVIVQNPAWKTTDNEAFYIELVICNWICLGIRSRFQMNKGRD